MPEPTPSQTIGPFFYDALIDECYASYTNRLVPEATPGITLRGKIQDGAGDPVPDAMVEIFHAAGDGNHPEAAAPEPHDFAGFGRCATDPNGGYEFHTVRPGASEGQAPYVQVSVFARGLLKRLVTRIYLPENEPENAGDPILNLVPEAARGRLVATRDGEEGYRFDVRLQGEAQTPFFDFER